MLKGRKEKLLDANPFSNRTFDWSIFDNLENPPTQNIKYLHPEKTYESSEPWKHDLSPLKSCKIGSDKTRIFKKTLMNFHLHFERILVAKVVC